MTLTIQDLGALGELLGSVAVLALLLGVLSMPARAEEAVGTRVQPLETWPIDVYLDARLVEGQPDWRARMREKFDWVNAALQTKNHELDVACPVEIVAASTTIYRVGEGGFVGGGGSLDNLRMPYDTRKRRSEARFEPSRLYLAPGPGWAFSRAAENASYAWVGKWEKGSGKGRGGGTKGLIDPWGRWGGWVIAHELGHLTGANHLVVRSPEHCSFMSYGEQMFPVRSARALCPEIGVRMLRRQCDLWQAKARRAMSALPGPD